MSMTFEEFLAWADEDTYAEWVDGTVIALPPPTVQHHRLLMFLASLLNMFVSMHALGEMIMAPFLMKLSWPPRARMPDLILWRRAIATVW
jgi:Uma2 family endonuclease